MFKKLKHYIPKGLLWRLASVNIIVITLGIMLIGWGVYETACSLTAHMGDLGEQRQKQFNATLFQYVLIFCIAGIVVGTVLHLHFTRKVIRPIKQLIDSTKQMKIGKYPAQLDVDSEGELADLVTHFNDMVVELEQNDHERKKLITDLSHEIRTPLSNITGYLQALQSGIVEADEALYTSLLKEAHRLGNMIEQLDQLKEWDQIESPKAAEYKEVDISHHIKQSVDMFQWKINEQKIDIVLDVKPQKLRVNPIGIEQVLNNILQNALQYYEGEGNIVVKGKQHYSESFYKVSITGPGKQINEPELNQVFNRFYRVDSSRSRQTGGTGLGLAIAKEIVEFHSGTIGIKSKDYMNTVWFTIPL